MKIKILVLHVSVGHGMKITAENIAHQLRKNPEYEVRIEDVQKIEKGILERTMVKIYSHLLEHFSGLWGFLYSSKVINFFALRVRRPFAAIRSKRILSLLREYQPAIVVSTETIPTGIVSYLKSKGLYRGKLAMAFSDYHLHEFWLYDQVDLYLCNIAEQAQKLKQLGVLADKIVVIGATISEKFLQPIVREDACRELGLLTSMSTVLMTSGSLVRMSTKDNFLGLLRSPRSFQIVVLCGTNSRLKAELEQISPPSQHPVKILGYINNMEKYMSASDVLVGKTGGPTMIEAVLKKLPMIMTDIRPGHELINLEFLLKNQIVEYARIPREVLFLVEQVLDSKIRKNFVHAHKVIIKPDNAISLLEALKPLHPEAAELKVSYYTNLG